MAAHTRLSSHATRAAAHAELARAQAKHLAAECREDPNAAEPYEVWSGPLLVEELTEIRTAAMTPQERAVIASAELAVLQAQQAADVEAEVRILEAEQRVALLERKRAELLDAKAKGWK